MFKEYQHPHPRNPNEVVTGFRLEPHEAIMPDDVYADSSGVWRPCGLALQGQAAGMMYVVRLAPALKS